MPVRPPTFRHKGQRSRREDNAQYDARRGSARERGYDTRWDRAAAAYKREHPLCVGCQAIDRVTAAAVVDHVVPHKGDQKLFWDRDNWQSACATHHDVVKQRLEAMLAEGKATPMDMRLGSALAMKISREIFFR